MKYHRDASQVEKNNQPFNIIDEKHHGINL